MVHTTKKKNLFEIFAFGGRDRPRHFWGMLWRAGPLGRIRKTGGFNENLNGVLAAGGRNPGLFSWGALAAGDRGGCVKKKKQPFFRGGGGAGIGAL